MLHRREHSGVDKSVCRINQINYIEICISGGDYVRYF